MDKYKESEMIVDGRDSQVYRGTDTETDEAVILRKFRYPKATDGIPSSLIREISLLMAMKHENILSLLDVQSAGDENSMYLIYEYIDIDLQKFMEYSPAKDPGLIKKFLKQILGAVNFYHCHEVLHQDLKPQNLLITPCNILKVAGNCLLTIPNENETPRYKSPELLLGLESNSFTAAVSDVWSVGCIFAEMLRQKPLFSGESDDQVLTEIFSLTGAPTEKNWDELKSSSSAALHLLKSEHMDLTQIDPDLESSGIELLSEMLCLDPSKRITAGDALRSAYFRDRELEVSTKFSSLLLF